jgi:hypothetical protein
MTNIKLLAIGVTVAIASLGAWAQASAPASTPRVDKREAVQEKRIEHGTASGQLTAHETARLEKEQTAIAKVEDKAKADGTVTAKERTRLHHLQRRASHHIVHQKHDAQTAASAPKP